MDPRTSTNSFLSVLANKAGDATTLPAVEIARATEAGAWTLGPASGLTTGHTIQSGVDTSGVFALTVSNSQNGTNSAGLIVKAGNGSSSQVPFRVTSASGLSDSMKITGDGNIVLGSNGGAAMVLIDVAPGTAGRGVIRSWNLAVSSGNSNAFSLPSGFVGHVYVRSSAGNNANAWFYAGDGNCVPGPATALGSGAATLNRSSNCNFYIGGLGAVAWVNVSAFGTSF
jgi:hypothetical protein